MSCSIGARYRQGSPRELTADGFEFPLHLALPPGYDWLVIVEQPGLVIRARRRARAQGSLRVEDHCGFVRSFRYEGGEITLVADGPGGELWLTTLEGRAYRFEPTPEDGGF